MKISITIDDKYITDWKKSFSELITNDDVSNHIKDTLINYFKRDIVSIKNKDIVYNEIKDITGVE